MNLGMKGRNHVARVHSARVAGHEPRPRLHGGQRRQARLLGGHQQVQDAGAGALGDQVVVPAPLGLLCSPKLFARLCEADLYLQKRYHILHLLYST